MHSTKEVMSGTGLEVSPDRTAPEALYPQNFQYNGYDTASQGPTVSLTNGKYHGREVPRVAGLRKPTFWLLVALFSVVALALGLGIGLGLGLRNHNVNNTGTAANSASTSDAPTTPSSLSSSITISTAASATASATASSGTTSSSGSTPTSGCPSRNGSIIARGTMNYKVYCDSDLTGSDLATLVTESLDDCLLLCDSMNWLQNRKDVGSVFNEAGTHAQAPGTCWCKGGDGISVKSNPGIAVASPVP